MTNDTPSSLALRDAPPLAAGPDVALLIDTDNFFKPEYADVGFAEFEYDVGRFVTFALELAPTATTVAIRLYGGWLNNHVLTQRASKFEQLINSVPRFPFTRPHSGQIVRGSIVLAKSLVLLPGLQWGATFRTRSGLPRIRLHSTPTPEGCSNTPPHCPIRSFAHFTKSQNKTCPVDGCTVVNAVAFKCVEQKMVDTLLACDLLALSHNMTTHTIALFTEDVDLLPSLAHAKISTTGSNPGCRFLLVLPRPAQSHFHREDLERLGIEYLTWSEA